MEQTAHALKGIAGSLGAVLLFALATQVEAAARDVEQHANLPDLMPELCTAMTEVVRHIRGLEPAQLGHDVLAAKQDAPKEIDALVQHLQDLLAEDDPQAEELWRTLRPQLAQDWPEDLLSELGKEIENFNFPKALQVLNAHSQASHLQAST